MPPLPDVSKRLDTLESDEAKAKSRAKGAVEARDLSEKAVVDDLVSLKGCVAQAVAENPGQAYAIITSAGMTPKGFSLHHKAALSVAMSGAPEEAVLRAKAVKGTAGYEWQASSDGGKTWQTLGFSTVSTFRAPGLTVGTTYLFRFRATVKTTTGDWSQPVAFLVH